MFRCGAGLLWVLLCGFMFARLDGFVVYLAVADLIWFLLLLVVLGLDSIAGRLSYVGIWCVFCGSE